MATYPTAPSAAAANNFPSPSMAELQKIWEENYNVPVAYYNPTNGVNLIIPFCLNQNSISAEGGGPVLMTIRLVTVVKAPSSENEFGPSNYLYLFKLIPSSKKSYLTSDSVYPPKRFAYLGVEAQLQNNGAGENATFDGLTYFYEDQKKVDAKSVTYAALTASPTLEIDYPVTMGLSNNIACEKQN